MKHARSILSVVIMVMVVSVTPSGTADYESKSELEDPEMIFFFSQSKKGNLNFFPIDLRQTHMIPAGRKASRVKKIMLKDVRKIEIFSGGTK